MNRRGFLATILAAATAPALIKYESLMRPRVIVGVAGLEIVGMPGLAAFPDSLALRSISLHRDFYPINVTTLLSNKEMFLSQPWIELDCFVPMSLDRDKTLHIDGRKIEDAYVEQIEWVVGEPTRGKIIVPYDKGFALDPKTARLTWE